MHKHQELVAQFGAFPSRLVGDEQGGNNLECELRVFTRTKQICDSVRSKLSELCLEQLDYFQ